MDKQAISLLVMDVDGTLTDGRINIGPNGELFKSFNVKDGLGIAAFRNSGVKSAILTGRQSEIVTRRANELAIDFVIQGISDKLSRLKELAGSCGIGLDSIAYIGDDTNDLDCITAVGEAGGLTGCPSDAAPSVRDSVSYVCEANGGEGAVREFIDWMMSR